MATSPAELDAIIRKTYCKIYDGNVRDQKKTTVEYMGKYSKFLFKQIQANIEDITAEDLETTAKMTVDSAAGMDQWALGDLNMLSREACKMLAKMMNAIEKGSP